jgi:splicing factor U2AF subunit
LTQWDIKPPGYENVTAEQAKLSGMFPLPGAPRQQPMDPSRLQAFMNQPGGGSADNSALKPSNSRQAKRLFVSNLPPGVSSEHLVSFFNLQLNGLNVIHSVDPCISAQISEDHSFALLEFKTPNDTTVALAFDGITMEEHESASGAENGAPKGLEVRRPKDYIVPNGSADQEYQEGVLLNEVPDSPNKICVSNIPQYIPEEPVTMLLKSFGELKSFVLVKDSSTEESRVSGVYPSVVSVLLTYQGYCFLRVRRPLSDCYRCGGSQRYGTGRPASQGCACQYRNDAGRRA